MRRSYNYVGPKAIGVRAPARPAGMRVESAEDVRRWVRQAVLGGTQAGSLTATFVIDEDGWMRIADRRSEHVACAGRRPVLSAGEITLAVTPGGVEALWVSNQSTGYCPEPESWPAVRAALERARISAPNSFHQECVFRRCDACGSINIVKESEFECGVCSSALPKEWNLEGEAIAFPNDKG
ncbi:MAG: hypothetical protein U0797_21795 [Gemmataceae bacterium]